MSHKTFNWLVRTYDAEGKLLDAWLIKERTEQEATNEAMADICTATVFDWSLTKESDSVN